MSAAATLSVGAIKIGAEEINIRFIHASGPGGQNVNKVATAVQLRFDLATSTALPADVKQRLVTIAGRRLNSNGELVITARRHRSQSRNRQDALDRLRNMIERAARRTRTRIATRPSRAAKKRRLEAKKRRGQIKISRRKPGSDE